MGLNAKIIYDLAEKFDITTIKELCMIEMKLSEAQKQENYKPTKSNRITALKNCLGNDENRKMMNYYWIESEKQLFCNGYVVVALNEHVLEFPERPENIDPPKNMYPMITSAIDNNSNTIKASEIKSIVQECIVNNKLRKKADKKASELPVIYENFDHKYAWNPLYMDNVIKALGGYDECSISFNDNNTVPFAIVSKLGSGLVLPVRIK